jgi:hypothetical protein
MGAFRSEYFRLRTAWMKLAQLSPPRRSALGAGWVVREAQRFNFRMPD